MSSPFPGMDPFIEAPHLWSDFHLGMLAAMRGSLNSLLPPNYVAAGDRHVWLIEPEKGEKLPTPDVLVTASHPPVSGPAAATIAAPAAFFFPAVRRQGHRFLKILEMPSRRVVTVLELLSPANKRGKKRKVYLRKRKDFLAAGVNLVEIDLLRGGKRLPLGEPKPAASDYYVLVSRSWEHPKVDFWPILLRDPLPPIPIPLDPGVAEVSLSLNTCFDRTYDEGRYDVELAYDQPLSVPLTEDDAVWVRSVLSNRPQTPP